MKTPILRQNYDASLKAELYPKRKRRNLVRKRSAQLHIRCREAENSANPESQTNQGGVNQLKNFASRLP